MTLPRFTSGQIGRLSFSDLNEAFDRIEEMPTMSGKPSASLVNQPAIVFIARVTATQGEDQDKRGAWEEVSLRDLFNDIYDPVSGGMTSSDGQSAYAIPLMPPVPEVGTVFVAVAHTTTEGKHYITQFLAKAPVLMGLVISHEVIDAGPDDRKWKYTLREASFDFNSEQQTGGWGSSGDTFIAFNGCENPTDRFPDQRNIGVGSKHTAYTAERMPIKLGSIVQCHKAPQGDFYYFSVPNGYAFGCYTGNPG